MEIDLIFKIAAIGIIVAVLSLALAALLGAIGYALEKGAQE